MFISMVANGTKIVVATLSALPSYSKDRLLTTSIAHCTIVLHSCWCRIQYTQVKGSRASIISCRAVIPNNHNLFRRFEISDGTHMTFSTILLNKYNWKAIIKISFKFLLLMQGCLTIWLCMPVKYTWFKMELLLQLLYNYPLKITYILYTIS